jgi:hypothetical protein
VTWPIFRISGAGVALSWRSQPRDGGRGSTANMRPDTGGMSESACERERLLKIVTPSEVGLGLKCREHTVAAQVMRRSPGEVLHPEDKPLLLVLMIDRYLNVLMCANRILSQFDL